MDSIQYAREQYLTKDTLHCVSCMGRAGPDRAGEGEGVWRETAMYGGAAIASISTSHGMLLRSGHHLRAKGCRPKPGKMLNLLPRQCGEESKPVATEVDKATSPGAGDNMPTIVRVCEQRRIPLSRGTTWGINHRIPRMPRATGFNYSERGARCDENSGGLHRET